MTALYNEFDPQAAAWLRWLIDEGLIPPGDVDERSIELVQPGDLDGYTHVHFFAGIGGWAYASLLAGWPADRPLWTGSCPCQPFSVAGQGRGADDPRHLWPHFFRLIRACRPPVVVGEQVAGKAGYGWFDGVGADLAGEHYACRAVDIPAAAVDSPQIRQRLYWVAVGSAERGGRLGAGLSEVARPDVSVPAGTDGREPGGAVADSDSAGPHATSQPGLHCGEEGRGPRHVDPSGLHGSSAVADARSSGSGRWPVQPAGDFSDRATAGRLEGPGGAPGCDEGRLDVSVERPQREGLEGHAGDVDDRAGRPQPDRPVAPTDERNGTFWSGADWIQCHDGKARRVADAGAPLLAHGIPGRVVAWRGFGNAIVPQEAAEVLAALMETT